MAIRMSSLLSKPSALGSLLSQARLAIRLMREPRVSRLLKVLPVLTGLYVVSPFDFVPDFIPGLGQLDDLAVLFIGVEIFIKLCPDVAQAFHRDAIAQGRAYSPMSSLADDVIDAEWRHE